MLEAHADGPVDPFHAVSCGASAAVGFDGRAFDQDAASGGGVEGRRVEAVQWRQLIETLPHIVWITRPDGWHVHFNQHWMDFTGLTLEDSLGFGWNAPFHPDDRGRAAARWSQATSTGEPYEIEYRLRRRDGTYRWMLGRALPLRNEAGEIVRWFGTCTDIDDLKRAQALLDESRSMHRLAGAMASLGGWTLDCATRELTWSEEIYGILEHPGDTEPDPELVLERLVPDSRERLVSAGQACATSGARFDLELELRSDPDHPRWLRIIGEARYGSDGGIAQLAGAVQDISAPKAASRRNELLADRLTTTLESISDGFYTLDMDWRFTYLNPRGEELLQRDRLELLGRHVWDEFAPAVGTAVEVAFRHAVADDTTVVLDEYYYEPLGAWFEINAYPSEQGLAVYFRDVSQRHRDQAALRERVKELRSLATINGAAHASTDLHELCEITARSLVAAMQHPAHVSTGVALGEYVHGQTTVPPGASSIVVPVAADGEERGQIVVVDQEGCPFLPEEDELVTTVAGTLGLWKDRHRATAELQRVNQELNAANAQLSDAARLKDDLISMASHELRTPLTPILGFVELMDTRGDNLTDNQRVMLRSVHRNARRMLGLVDDLLVISRAAADGLRSWPESIGVRDHVLTVLDDLGETVTGVQVDIEEQCSANVDPQQFHQMVANLLTNATKYGAPPVTIRATTSGTRVLIEVEDHGSGVPVDLQPHMWDRFVQRDRGDRRTSSGTGLGLAIVKLLAELNNGSASYRDAPTSGAVFCLDLPSS